MIKIVSALALGLLFSLPVQAGSFTPAQEKEIGDLVRSYILDNPEILIEAGQALQSKQMKAADDAVVDYLKEKGDTIFGDPTHFSLGNVKGDAVFVEFFDYNCGYCKLAYPELVKATKNDPNIKIILIDTPILGPASELAARWAIAAGQMGKYLDYHQALMEFKGPKDEASLTKLAEKVNIDPVKLKEKAASSEVQKQLENNMRLFIDMKRNSTPTFFTRKGLVQGEINAAALQQIAKDLRTKK